MLIHLESGNCASEATEGEIDSIAQDYFQSGKYIDDNGDDVRGWMYICRNCGREFFKLSALYQHAEDVILCSPALKGNGCLAKLERFIARCFERS